MPLSSSKFSLTLFSINPEVIRQAIAAGVDEVIVDWENQGKKERQNGADTEINEDTLSDLCRVRDCTDATVICRINRYSAGTPDEIELAIGAGADEILLPMVQSCAEVEAALKQVNGRCGVGILVETIKAVDEVKSLADLHLSRVYVGLNDLAIQRVCENIFMALIDGTLERIRRPFATRFGFGGLTLPDHGYPIPCRLLIGEMTRLHCDFSFLRRSFRRDMVSRELGIEIPRLIDAIERSRLRPPEVVTKERQELQEAILAWPQRSGLLRERSRHG